MDTTKKMSQRVGMENNLVKGWNYQFSSEEDMADCFYSEKLKKFCIMFNAKLETFKKFSGLQKRLLELREQYTLNAKKIIDADGQEL